MKILLMLFRGNDTALFVDYPQTICLGITFKMTSADTHYGMTDMKQTVDHSIQNHLCYDILVALLQQSLSYAT